MKMNMMHVFWSLENYFLFNVIGFQMIFALIWTSLGPYSVRTISLLFKVFTEIESLYDWPYAIVQVTFWYRKLCFTHILDHFGVPRLVRRVYFEPVSILDKEYKVLS